MHGFLARPALKHEPNRTIRFGGEYSETPQQGAGRQ